jgi:hypothetical protein
MLPAQEEIEYESEILLEDEIQMIVKEKDIGFRRGSMILNTGFLYASSHIGCEFEVGINKILGIGLGFGYIGANCSANFHVYSKKYVDLYIGIAADYIHEIEIVVPEISFNFRGFLSEKARIGGCGKIGIAIGTQDKSFKKFGKTIHVKKARPMLTYSIGIPIKLKT